MHRIDNATAATNIPAFAAAGTPGYWTKGSPASGVAATIMDQDWFNAFQEELIAVVVAGGLIPAKATLTQLRDAIQALIVAGSGWSTGDGKITLKTSADTGWIMADDGSLGSAASGATTRANADTTALFTLLWNNTSNADLVIQTSAGANTTRGASAAADFAANKRIPLPKALGRALALAGAGSGLTARALGAAVGTETVTLTAAQQATMPLTWNGGALLVTSGGSGVAVSGGPNAGLDGTGQATGGGEPHTNMQPTIFFNFMIKL